MNYQYLRPSMMWLLGALAFLLQYACRVAPSHILDPISMDFGLTSTAVGLIGPFFLLPYIGMQLFVGRIVDRFPPHYVLIVTTLIFFLANQFFSEAINLKEIAIARAVMGMMGSFTFVVTMKIAMIWFENRFLGVLSGLTQVSGMLGAVVGAWAIDGLMIGTEWRPVIKVFSILMGGLVFLMLALMRNKRQKNRVKDVSILQGLRTVMSNPQSWYNGLYAGLIYLPTAAFGEHWGKLYLEKTNVGMSAHDAAIAISMIFVGWAIGGVLSGVLSDHLGRRKPLMLLSPLLCLAVLLPVVYIHTLPAVVVSGLLFVYGIFNSPLVIAYAISGEINPPSVAGVSISFCNMASILLGTATMPMMGWIMDHYAIMINGTVVYSLKAYESAVSLFPVSLLLALLAAVCIQETHGKQVEHE